MNKQSLLELKHAINEYLMEQSTMDKVDKLELIININQFLEPKMYEENRKVLAKNKKGVKNEK